MRAHAEGRLDEASFRGARPRHRPLTLADQRAKLRLVVETAREVRGEE